MCEAKFLACVSKILNRTFVFVDLYMEHFVHYLWWMGWSELLLGVIFEGGGGGGWGQEC